MKLKVLLDEYQSGRLGNKLAKGGPHSSVSSQQILQSSLDEFWKFNDRILVFIMVVLTFFVLLLGVLIWKYNSQTSLVLGLIAGESGGIYFAINRMHALYKESLAARMLHQLLLNASNSEEKGKLIDSINGLLNNI